MSNMIAVILTIAFTAFLIIGCARHIERDLSVKKAGKETVMASTVKARSIGAEGAGKQGLQPEKEKKVSEEKGLTGVLRKGLKTGVYLFGWTP